jgi:hypothetical protein
MSFAWFRGVKSTGASGQATLYTVDLTWCDVLNRYTPTFSFTQPRFETTMLAALPALRMPTLPPSRSTPARSEIPAGIVVTVLSGLAILLRPDSALWGLRPLPPPSAAAAERTKAICRPDGWLISAELSPPPAPRGVATKALFGDARDVRSNSRVLELLCRFELDEGSYDLAECSGTAKLLRDSRLLASSGPWTALLDGDGTPQALQWRLRTTANLQIDDGRSGSTTLPVGTMLQFDATFHVDEASARVAVLVGGAAVGSPSGLCMGEGRIRVQVPSQLSLTLGVAEFREVGTFRGRLAPRRPGGESL